MARYGILITNTNTGLDIELAATFAAPLSIINNAPAFMSDVISLKRVVTSQKVQRWEIETHIVPTNNTFEFASHVFRNNNDLRIFVRMPQIYNLGRDNAGVNFNSNVLTTSNSRVKGDSQVGISGVGTVPIFTGEFFKFDSHSKVYYAYSASASSISFYPPLVHDVPSGDNIFHGDRCTMEARYDGNKSSQITFSDGILLDPGSVTLIEAI